MFRRANQTRKRTPSDHEKRIRFFTWLSILLVIVFTIGLFLLINLQQIVHH
jgi:hypothetical protein